MIRRAVFLIMILVGIASTIAAQEQCPTIVQQAVEVMDSDCATIERNQACYGHGSIEAIPQPDATLDEFDSAGDVVSIVDVQSLSLSELDESLEVWGVALLSVQANLPATLPGQNVTILLFGETEITNAGEAMEAFFFSTGVGSSDCAQAPNGILIQSPDEQEGIELTINNVGVELGSTAYLTAEPENMMTFALLEGNATLTAEDGEVSLEAGEFSTIELDADLSAVSAPSDPEPLTELPELPLEALPRLLDEETTTSDSDDTDVAASDELIIPQNGDWTYTRGEIQATSGCPAMMTSTLAQNTPITETAFVDFGGVAFDMETFLTTNSTEPLPNFGEFSQPELNVQQWSYSEQGTSFTYQIAFISESFAEGFFHFDLSGTGMACELTIPFQISLE